MPQNITDVTTFTAPIVAPQDGDGETAGSVLTGLQGLANRTAFLNNILGTVGVTLLRSGSSATMTALSMTAGQDGQIFYRRQFGIYEYKNPSALTVDNQWVFTAAGAASGQWVHELFFNLDSAGTGIAAIGPFNGNGVASGRIQPTVVPYGVLGSPNSPSYSASVTMATSSVSFVPMTGAPTITFGSLLVGDIVEVVAPAAYNCNSNCSLGALVSENGGAFFSVTPTQNFGPTTGGLYAPAPLGFMRTVATSGAYQIQFWGNTTNGANALTVAANTIYARVLRP